jgi:emfourin
MSGTGKRARISFERSGGFGGLSLRTEVDTAKLADDQAREYDDMLSGLDLPRLAGTQNTGGADRFQYDLAIHLGDEKYAMHYGEQSLPSELKPLVTRLTQDARHRPA